MPKDAVTQRRGRRPAGFCKEQTPVMIEQFRSMERDAFHLPYLSDKTPEAAFHGPAVKTVAYLRVSTAQQDLCSQRLAILERGVSSTAIAKFTGVSRTTLYSFMSTRGLKPSP